MPADAADERSGRRAGRAAAALRGQWLLRDASADCAPATRAASRNLVLMRQLRETLGREKDRVDKIWLRHRRGAAGDAVARGQRCHRVARRLAALSRLAGAGAPASALEDHLYLVDPMGNWMMRVPVDPDPARLKRDLERLLRASASWDRAGR